MREKPTGKHQNPPSSEIILCVIENGKYLQFQLWIDRKQWTNKRFVCDLFIQQLFPINGSDLYVFFFLILFLFSFCHSSAECR